ncbi:toll/interleukin-1 receptor domain-containing protein [Rhizobium leguminosarum]|uniref:toll/interleukin-1 receptor domain-containing protein n=1 Tax=Rhizobium leguminosarum TaxID=384 RepID=UPI001C98A1B4|nr:toll/interleukin-1 receptor domain-containing protein [Rhizobium leguminosarum]MBY5405939.1 toll/interleukin-1 receptor domain-containing protein [Rhizobium leguminosarum]
MINSPAFFVSYAREDVKHEQFRENFRTFIADLGARVAGLLAIPIEDAYFVDENIETGELWPEQLKNALMKCKASIVLYSPSYFTREWCGKEFQVLLDRCKKDAGVTGIIPVRWLKTIPELPASAAKLQYQDGRLPPEYSSRGMRQLAALRGAYPTLYEDVLDVLADRIVDAVQNEHLTPLDSLDFDSVKSAWSPADSAQPSHMRGNISKTCFVYLAREGWDWKPYDPDKSGIGALSQKISGGLGLRYEEIHCNSTLSQKLKETYENDVPTVLFLDPKSLGEVAVSKSMEQYDEKYYLNCAAIVPWEAEVEDKIEDDTRWITLQTMCPQKVGDPPPYHEWRTIFSQSALEERTAKLIEEIRSRLMKKLMSGSSGPSGSSSLRRAADTGMSEIAAAMGISTGSLPSLGSPDR